MLPFFYVSIIDVLTSAYMNSRMAVRLLVVENRSSRYFSRSSLKSGILCYHTPASRFGNLIVLSQTHQWIDCDARQSGMTPKLRDAIITALLNSPGKPLPISLEISYGLPVCRAHFSDTVMSSIHPLRKPLRPPEQESLSSCRISLPVHENIRASCG